MESKKNPRLDLQKKQPVFIQLGLILSLSTVLLAFEYKSTDKAPFVIPVIDDRTSLTELVPVTHQTPPKSQLPAMPRILTTIDITDDPVFDDSDFVWREPGDLFEIRPFTDVKLKRETSHDDPEKPPTNIEVLASFKGGDQALFEWLGKNLKYPLAAVQAGIEGTVYVRFVVELDGNITRIGIEQGNLGGGCEEAAMEAVARMPKWIPGRQRNKPVVSTFILPVEFRLQH